MIIMMIMIMIMLRELSRPQRPQRPKKNLYSLQEKPSSKNTAGNHGFNSPGNPTWGCPAHVQLNQSIWGRCRCECLIMFDHISWVYTLWQICWPFYSYFTFWVHSLVQLKIQFCRRWVGVIQSSCFQTRFNLLSLVGGPDSTDLCEPLMWSVALICMICLIHSDSIFWWGLRVSI